MAKPDAGQETRDERDRKVERDRSAKLVRDLAVTPPAKTLDTLKAAVDVAENNRAAGSVSASRSSR